MKRPKHGSTPKQFAYAQRRLSGGGATKKEMALLSGFSPSTAENAKYKIEETEGYKIAMLDLATKSNNVLLKLFAEYELRGLDDFSNSDLNGALNAISSAWEKIEKRRNPDTMKTEDGNPLRRIFMQKVENQTVHMAPIDKKVIKDVEVKEDIDLDF